MDWSVSQLSPKDSLGSVANMHLIVRGSSDPQAIIPSLRSIFHELDPGLPFRQPQTMQEVVADVLVFERLENWLFGTFGALAALLAIVGLYGLISHEVELSIRDIGLRMALGATRIRVVAAVYRRVSVMLLFGVTLGLLVTVCVQKLISAVVVIRSGKDLDIIFALAAGLFTVGLLSVLLPARRAASVDPMVALRYE
jgi:ABC-type antimicrobial peptide transport system permease subunit